MIAAGSKEQKRKKKKQVATERCFQKVTPLY
jgi:hypothetical protein